MTTPIQEQLYTLKFLGNHGKYGEALYVADHTNSGTCSADNECFIQTLAVPHRFFIHYTKHILFSGNTAIVQGHDIFGGLLDRCIPSFLAEVHLGQPDNCGVSYLQIISSITSLGSIDSQPVQVCFC